MEVIVRGKHFEVPDHIEERARTKLGKLSHYLPALQDALVEVDLTHEKAKDPDRRYLVRVIVSGHGVHLQAEEHAKEPETAVDAVAHVVTRQAERYKERLYGRGRRGEKAATAEPAEAEATTSNEDRVARVKRFPVKPMSTSEAVEQMELLGHDFFLFHDADAERIAVLYRRRAGDYGVIIPELS
jgi:putative sigma-54 modulation protein